MNENCKHNIQVLNLKNAELINHPLLLIRGTVSKPCDRENKISCSLLVTGSSVSRELKQEAPHTHGDFKVIVNLNDLESVVATSSRQQLQLSVCYCNTQLLLDLSYAPAASAYRLQPLYIICDGADNNETCPDSNVDLGEFLTRDGSAGSAATACQLIDLNLLLVQTLYAEKLRDTNSGQRHTFTLQGKCQLFRSTLSCDAARRSTEDELWQTLAKEILNSALGGDPCLKFVAFIACSKYNGAAVAKTADYSYANIRRHLQAHAALGGGGLALFGSAFFYAWPQKFEEIQPSFLDETAVDLTRFPDDSNYRRTLGGVYATTLGAVCHELGHIFDLGHTSDGIMGNGFDYVNRVFTLGQQTEHLPQRHIYKGVLEAPQGKPRPRFTQLRKSAGDSSSTSSTSFLDKYREQRHGGDSCFFARNCVIILTHHKWLRTASSTIDESTNIAYDSSTQTITCASPDAFRLVEIRCNENSLVQHFYEFPTTAQALRKFTLPIEATALRGTHYIFVITTAGYTERIQFGEVSGAALS